jgi:thymidylate synthase
VTRLFYLDDLREGYRDLLRALLQAGARVDVRELPTRELAGVTLVFSDPTAPLLPVGIGRKINTRLAAVESLSVIAGESRVDLIRRAAPRYDRVLIDPSSPEYGAYGPRVGAQFRSVVRLLRRDPTSRRAVISIWDTRDLVHPGDKPCTLTLQFLVRPDRAGVSCLEMIVNMRSQDVWLGVGMDMFVFGQLRDTLARELEVEPGTYVHHVGSLHLYERDVTAATAVICRDPAMDGTPESLPHGVALSGPLYRTPENVARELLKNTGSHFGDQVRSANPWYAARITAIYESEGAGR